MLEGSERNEETALRRLRRIRAPMTLTAVAVSCLPTQAWALASKAVPFRTVVHGEAPGSAPAQADLKIDVGRHSTTIRAYAGAFGHGGYRLTIRRILVTRADSQRRQFCVVAHLRVPGRQGIYTPAISHPAHFVVVRRSSLPRRVPKQWVLLEPNGDLLGKSRLADPASC